MLRITYKSNGFRVFIKNSIAMDLKCLNSIVQQGLAIHIDLTDNESWNLNDGFTSISLNQWANAKSERIHLYDFGLTAYDNGRVTRMYDSLDLYPNDTKLTLYRVGYNTASGGTYYDGYGITGVTETEYIFGLEYSGVTASTTTGGTFVGNHFNLDGGYLQGFYKLYNYNYELLPARFDKGITIETVIRIDEESFSNDGIIFLMGERAEDKYNMFFSGETTQLTPTQTSTSNQKEVINYVPASNSFSGVTTSELNYLAAYKTGGTTPVAYKDFDHKQTDSYILQPPTSINGNVVSLFLAKNGALGFKYIDDAGVLLNRFSSSKITNTGWTIITLAFKPYEVFNDEEKLRCEPRRKGDFVIYVNGRQFWKIQNFDEFFFKNVKNQKEKQLGVPFNISWGGGSFGLQHSWHYDFKTYKLYDADDQSYINTNFIQKTNPLIDDPCVAHITGTSATTGVQLLSNSNTFFMDDECDPDVLIPVTVLEVDRFEPYSGDTGTTGTSLYNYYFEFDQPLELLSNREYLFRAKIYDSGIFQSFDASTLAPAISSVDIVVYGSVDIEIVEDFGYDGNTPGEWIEISKRIKLKDNTGLQTARVGINVQSTEPLSNEMKFYVDDFFYSGPDILVKDQTKDGLTMESNFNNSFIGGIQKLRIYDYGFNSQEALHNAFWELRGNPALGFNVTRGGRLIYK